MDSVLINVPVSSPLHPQANLPYIKGFLAQNGFNSKIIDANIRFFNWMLRGTKIDVRDENYFKNPAEILSLYNDIERVLAEKSRKYRNLHLGLRNISLDYDRVEFESVLASLEDREANPFIDFFELLIREDVAQFKPEIIGIGIIFQDQIIAAFTLSNVLRKLMPDAKIVLGGQIITRCYDTLLQRNVLNHLWDFLVCWDGELPLLDVHKRVINGSSCSLHNVIVKDTDSQRIGRHYYAYDLDRLRYPDFTDLNFEEYLFPEMMVPLQTARGCYGSCEFCAIPAGSNSGFRERTVKNIIADIVHVQQFTLEKYGNKALYFKFMDDTSSPATLLELAKEIESRNMEAQWETFVRLEKIFESHEKMEQLHRGGCRKLMWGLETNNPDILKRMSKKISPVSTTKVLNASAQAGILNFVFVLIGFPGETREQRDGLIDYIVDNNDIHVLTIATFDLTKRSPIQNHFSVPNPYGLDCDRPRDFEVRLPYTVNGMNWKEMMVAEAHRMLVNIIKKRPDIGFMSLFPDQVRGILCDKYGNDWGRKYLADFGQGNITRMLMAAEDYIDKFNNYEEIDLSILPEPIKREHARTREDIKGIAGAIKRRKQYEKRRMKQL